MKAGGEILLIVAAGFAIWLAVTDRLKNVQQAWQTVLTAPGGVFGPAPPSVTPSVTPGTVPGTNLPVSTYMVPDVVQHVVG
jgi:hypothetical protein